jgi:hypothetical protein
MGKEKSKCKIRVPYLARLRNNTIVEYIDKNLILLSEEFSFNLYHVKINWNNEMFEKMSLTDCWSYAYRLMYYIFEFRKIKKNIFLMCSFSTYTRGKIMNCIDYGMPSIYLLLVNKKDDFLLINELIEFIKNNSKFKYINIFSTVIRDPCETLKYMFNGCNNSFLIRMIPDNYIVHWYSSIEKLRSFMRIIKLKSIENNFRLNCKEIE